VRQELYNYSKEHWLKEHFLNNGRPSSGNGLRVTLNVPKISDKTLTVGCPFDGY
jgi:hypothetical protein